MFRRRTVALAAALALLSGGALAQGAHEEKYPERNRMWRMRHSHAPRCPSTSR